MTRNCPPNSISYNLKSGDTLYRIALRYNTTVPTIITANPGLNPNNLMTGQQLCIPRGKQHPSCPKGNYYTIKAGDTIHSIARFFNISVNDLIKANPGIDANNLTRGKRICIPLATPAVKCPKGTKQYIVKKGETFYTIARKFNTSVESLYRYNSTIKNGRALLIGQKLCIPVKK